MPCLSEVFFKGALEKGKGTKFFFTTQKNSNTIAYNFYNKIFYLALLLTCIFGFLV